MDEKSSEEFLRLAADKGTIFPLSVDVLRDILRAVGSHGDDGAITRAAKGLHLLIKLVARSEQPPSLYELLIAAVRGIIEPYDEGTAYDRAISRAARAGALVLAERSATDNAARGRASQRERALLEALEDIEEARKADNAKYADAVRHRLAERAAAVATSTMPRGGQRQPRKRVLIPPSKKP